MPVDPLLLRRIEDQVGFPGLTEALATGLGAADLNSLLLEVFRRRAGTLTPAQVLSRHARSRFTGASPLPYADLRAASDLAYEVLGQRFRFLELSPLLPLGGCAAPAEVEPLWSIAALRGTEVVSDVTSALALEAALLRRQARDDARLAAIGRVVRPQVHDNPAALSHFSLLGLLSTGRDRGGFRFEAEALGDHIRGYLALVRRWFPAGTTPWVSYTCPDPADPRLAALFDLAGNLAFDLDEKPERRAACSYYAGFCLNVDVVLPSGRRYQIADLGAVAWGARLLGDAKERTVVSGVGLDRLVTLRAEARSAEESTK